MKEATLSPGQSRIVIRREFSSVPMSYRFTARPTSDGGELRGTVEIRRTRIFSKAPPETFPLQPENQVAAGFWDTFVTVTVHAESEMIVASNRMPGKNLLPVLLLAFFVILVAAIVFWLAFL